MSQPTSRDEDLVATEPLTPPGGDKMDDDEATCRLAGFCPGGRRRHTRLLECSDTTSDQKR